MKAKLFNISTIMLSSAMALFADDKSTEEVNTIGDISYAKTLLRSFPHRRLSIMNRSLFLEANSLPDR